MPTQKKIDTVAHLTDKIARAKSMIFLDYRGLKHKQMEELRRNLKKSQGELTVAKNRLLIRSLSDTGESLRSVISDTTATLFSYSDEVAPLKDLLKFIKNAGAGKTKGGLLGATVLTESDVARLAALPSRTTLLSGLAGQLNAPIQNLHHALQWNVLSLVYALTAIEKKKSVS